MGRTLSNPADRDGAAQVREIETLAIALERLVAQGEDESDEGEQLREQMEERWWQLSDLTRRRIEGMADDLASLFGPSEDRPSGGTTRDLTDASARIDAAVSGAEWDDVLRLLRSYPSYESHQAAKLRAEAYDAIGLGHAAALFAERARELTDSIIPPVSDRTLPLLTTGERESGSSLTDSRVGDDAFPLYESALLLLHHFIADGLGDEEEANKLREAMDEYAQALSHNQLQWLDELSGDLYLISNQESRKPSPSPTKTAEDVTNEIRLARSEKRWDALLFWLRWPSTVTTAEISWLRYLAYKRIGHPNVALAFLFKAIELDPTAWGPRLSMTNELLMQRAFEDARRATEENILRFGLKPDLILQRAQIIVALVDEAKLPRSELRQALEEVMAVCVGYSATEGISTEHTAYAALLECKIRFELGDTAGAREVLQRLLATSAMSNHHEAARRLLAKLNADGSMPSVLFSQLILDTPGESNQQQPLAA